MRRRNAVLACCLFLFSSALFSQTPADPITGTWSGELQMGHASGPYVIAMNLKLEANGAVSGTFTGLPAPGDVKVGAFDARSGALKLQLGKTGEDAVLLVLDGLVVKGTVTGKISGDGAGDFRLTRK